MCRAITEVTARVRSLILIVRDRAHGGFGRLGGVEGIVVEGGGFGATPYIRIGESCCLWFVRAHGRPVLNRQVAMS
jgi:hypothetical protein